MLINGANVGEKSCFERANLLSSRYDKKLPFFFALLLLLMAYFCAVNFYRLSLLLAA